MIYCVVRGTDLKFIRMHLVLLKVNPKMSQKCEVSPEKSSVCRSCHLDSYEIPSILKCLTSLFKVLGSVRFSFEEIYIFTEEDIFNCSKMTPSTFIMLQNCSKLNECTFH